MVTTATAAATSTHLPPVSPVAASVSALSFESALVALPPLYGSWHPRSLCDEDELTPGADEAHPSFSMKGGEFLLPHDWNCLLSEQGDEADGPERWERPRGCELSSQVRHHEMVRHMSDLVGRAASDWVVKLEKLFALQGDGFYKHMAPCNAPTYRRGDSWQEELGLSSRQLSRVWKRIGLWFGSETKWNQHVKHCHSRDLDPFDGRAYVAVYSRKRGRTLYLRCAAHLAPLLAEAQRLALAHRSKTLDAQQTALSPQWQARRRAFTAPPQPSRPRADAAAPSVPVVDSTPVFQGISTALDGETHDQQKAREQAEFEAAVAALPPREDAQVQESDDNADEVQEVGFLASKSALSGTPLPIPPSLPIPPVPVHIELVANYDAPMKIPALYGRNNNAIPLENDAIRRDSTEGLSPDDLAVIEAMFSQSESGEEIGSGDETSAVNAAVESSSAGVPAISEDDIKRYGFLMDLVADVDLTQVAILPESDDYDEIDDDEDDVVEAPAEVETETESFQIPAIPTASLPLQHSEDEFSDDDYDEEWDEECDEEPEPELLPEPVLTPVPAPKASAKVALPAPSAASVAPVKRPRLAALCECRSREQAAEYLACAHGVSQVSGDLVRASRAVVKKAGGDDGGVLGSYLLHGVMVWCENDPRLKMNVRSGALSAVRCRELVDAIHFFLTDISNETFIRPPRRFQAIGYVGGEKTRGFKANGKGEVWRLGDKTMADVEWEEADAKALASNLQSKLSAMYVMLDNWARHYGPFVMKFEEDVDPPSPAQFLRNLPSLRTSYIAGEFHD